MGSSVFNSFGGSRFGGNPMQMMSQFMAFKKNLSGDPKKMVEKMLADGTMTQDQYNQLSGMVEEFKSMANMIK